MWRSIPSLEGKKGITLIELVVTMVVGGIVCLGVGTILYISWLHWRKGGEKIELQREGTLAFHWIRKATQKAGEAFVLGEEDNILLLSDPLEGWEKRFYREEDKLVVEENQKKEVIVDGVKCISFFSPAKTVKVKLKLGKYGHQTQAETVVFIRNIQYLKGDWHFDEGEGDTAVDSSGYGNDGFIRGASWTLGREGYCLSFDGVNDLVDFGSPSSLDFENELKIEFYFQLKLRGKEQVLLSRGRSRSFPLSEEISYQVKKRRGTSQIEFILSTNRGTYSLRSPNLELNQWHHFLGTWKNQEMKLYINGELINYRTTQGKLLTTPLPLVIGADSVYNFNFKGLIDEVRVCGK